MIQLHVLGRDDDGSLLLAAHPDAEAAGYRVVVDDDVLDLLGVAAPVGAAGGDRLGDEVDAGEPEPEPEPELVLPEGPIEVDSPAEALEAAHGLWIIHGEGDEDGQVAISDEPLHEAVLANLHRWNVRIPAALLDEGWYVTKLGDRAWQIGFRFLSRGRIHEAEWVLDTERARLVPENPLADVLGWVKAASAPQRRSRRRRGGRGRSKARGGQRPSARSGS